MASKYAEGIPLDIIDNEVVRAKAATLDVDGNGSISLAELVKAVDAYDSLKKDNSRLVKALLLLSGLLFATIAIQTGLTYAVVEDLVEYHKHTDVGSDGRMHVKGKPDQTVSTASALTTASLSPNLPNAFFDQLHHVNVPVDGVGGPSLMHLRVTGYFRESNASVEVRTDLGNLEVGSDGIRVDSTLASILNQKGMAVSTDGASGGRRKLSGKIPKPSCKKGCEGATRPTWYVGSYLGM